MRSVLRLLGVLRKELPAEQGFSSHRISFSFEGRPDRPSGVGLTKVVFRAMSDRQGCEIVYETEFSGEERRPQYELETRRAIDAIRAKHAE